MSEGRCPLCGANAEIFLMDYKKVIQSASEHPSGARQAARGGSGAQKKQIVIPNVKERHCRNAKCGHKWLPGEEEARINNSMRNFIED